MDAMLASSILQLRPRQELCNYSLFFVTLCPTAAVMKSSWRTAVQAPIQNYPRAPTHMETAWIGSPGIAALSHSLEHFWAPREFTDAW